MRNVKRCFTICSLALLFSIATMMTAKATVETINDEPILALQQWRSLAGKKKSTSTNYGEVTLTYKTADVVTFVARAYTNGNFSNPGEGALVNQERITYRVGYDHIYGVGQEMRGRYRNHNWTTNERRMSGVFNYF